jgi:hypothetical protein
MESFCGRHALKLSVILSLSTQILYTLSASIVLVVGATDLDVLRLHVRLEQYYRTTVIVHPPC